MAGAVVEKEAPHVQRERSYLVVRVTGEVLLSEGCRTFSSQQQRYR
jgi:hypothetical protein